MLTHIKYVIILQFLFILKLNIFPLKEEALATTKLAAAKGESVENIPQDPTNIETAVIELYNSIFTPKETIPTKSMGLMPKNMKETILVNIRTTNKLVLNILFLNRASNCE